MASTTGQTLSTIEDKILSAPKSFTFERLLTHLHSIVTARGDDPLQKIKVRPALTMQLTRTEIMSVNKNEHNEYDVVTNFMGLYGASSPMPAFYTEELFALEQEEQTTARRFLDVIHQRLYQLFAVAQKKYDALSQIVEHQQNGFSQLMHHFIGSSDPSLQKSFSNPNSLLQFSGLLASKQRSAQGLKALLTAYLADLDIAIQVEQYVQRSVTVPKQHLSSLGVNSCELGSSALVGDKVIDHNSKINIHLGPLAQDTFDQLVNNSERWQCFQSLIKAYIDKPLEVDIKIGLITKAANGIRLGEKQWCQLGYDTWLLKEESADDGDVEDILVTTLSLM